MKDFQLDFPCVSFKEKGETAESERPGERENWKVCFEMSGTFPLAFFDDFFQNFTARIFARARKENDFQEFAQILMGAGGLMSPQNDYIFIFFMLVRVRKCVELFY